MSQETPNLSDKSSQLIRRESELARLPLVSSSALADIIDRSLVHIQKNNALEMRNRIGAHELSLPDFRLVCAFAKDLQLTPEEVLNRLLMPSTGPIRAVTTIENGQFKVLRVAKEILPVSSFPYIEGLVVEMLHYRLEPSSNLDLSMFPKLAALFCDFNGLTRLNLSQIPNLKGLFCHFNRLTELDLFLIPNLETLGCTNNQLKELDFSQTPLLTELYCWDNRLTELDLSQVPNLIELWCHNNQLTELDIRNLRNLKSLKHDPGIRLIQRPDQNF
jgi:Leucine-rich repeat (LRR) protein